MDRNNTITRFNFNSLNLESEKDKLLNILDMAKKDDVKIQVLKNFPPCLANLKKNVDNNSKIILSKDSVLLTNNLFFGENYVKLNRLFHNSPFIDQECKECKYFKNSLCRGIFNNKFENAKKEILSRLGEVKYNAIESDYRVGMFVFGSICNCDCKFCYDRKSPLEMLKRIPALSMFEIQHFLHYIGEKVNYIGSSIHCASGELLYHTDAKKILSLLHHFCNKGCLLFTNGLLLDEDFIKRLQDKFTIALSVHTLDNNSRKELFRYNSDFDIKKTMSLLESKKVKYSCWVIPFNSRIESGDFLRTITYLFDRTSSDIYISKSGTALWHEPEMISDLDIDEGEVRELLSSFTSSKRISFVSDVYGTKNDISYYISRVKEIIKKSKYNLILCPKRTYNEFQSLNDNFNKVLSVDSTYGIVNPCCGVTLVRDYLSVIEDLDLKYKRVILSKSSFDINLFDIANEDINTLTDKLDVNSEVILI